MEGTTMQSIWKGSLAFGLVNVPVKLYSATEDHDVRFHQVHAADGGRVQYKRVCSVCGRQVEYAEIAKAYDAPSGERVVMTAEDFDELPVSKDREIDVVEFVPSDQVDPILFDRSYYLEPDARSVKAYVLLRETLARTDRTAIVRVALRQKTRLAALRVRGDVLVLQTMLWQDEVRAPEFGVLEGREEVKDRELAMAESIVDNLSGDFDPTAFKDEYREQLLTLIDAKLKGGEDVFAAAESKGAGDDADSGGQVLDLMAALQASVDRTAGSSAGGARSTGKAKKAAKPAKATKKAAKPAAKKAAAGTKGAAKKTTTKKRAAAKKPARRSA
jgi:DNA end-binding protein Ku